jgi:tetratricopeptide (TPR) repeat protein
VLQQHLLPAELQEALLERAGGNPLYAEQFARFYLEHRSVADVSVPENVQGIISARLDALPDAEKQLLQDAAVLGKVFWSGAIASSDRDAVLHALERKAFIRRERRSAVAGETEYAFRHVLVREVAYGQIPRPARAAKHVAAAEWVESLGRSDDHAELLAHHYATALELARATGQETEDLVERARLALRDAGDRAAALGSNGVAAGLYQSALELWPPHESSRPLVLYALGRAEYTNGDASADRLHEAIDALLGAGFTELAGEAEAIAAEAAWYRGDRAEVDRHLERALELVVPLQPSRAKAWALSQVSRYAMLAANYERALEYGTQALDMATELNLPDVRISALNNVGSARGRMGDPRGLADMKTGVTLAEEANSPELARMLNNLASLLHASGDVRRCFDLEVRSVEVAERFGLGSMVAFSRVNILGSYYVLGRWDEAFAAATSLLAEGPAAQVEANTRTLLAWLRVARGDLAGADDDSEFGLDIGRRSEEPETLMPALTTRAYVLDACGRVEEARPLLEELLERTERLGPNLPFAAPGEAVDVWLRLVGPERVAESLAWRTQASPWLDAARAQVSGELEQALEIYDQIGVVADVALMHLRLAQRDTETVPRADHLNAALTFYRSVGATRHVQQAERLLAASA